MIRPNLRPTAKLWARRLSDFSAGAASTARAFKNITTRAVISAWSQFWRHLFAIGMIVLVIGFFWITMVFMATPTPVSDDELKEAAKNPCMRDQMSSHLSGDRQITRFDFSTFDMNCRQKDMVRHQRTIVK
jgi:hypothetical protein